MSLFISAEPAVNDDYNNDDHVTDEKVNRVYKSMREPENQPAIAFSQRSENE